MFSQSRLLVIEWTEQDKSLFALSQPERLFRVIMEVYGV